MGAGRNLLVFCLPLAVLCHNHGNIFSGPSPVTSGQPQIIPQPQLPIFPIDGRRCISIARQTKIVEMPLPYLCIPGKPGGVPVPTETNKKISAILVAMYWHGWRVCKYTMKTPVPQYIRVPTCCPGWESGPSGECSVPTGRQMTGPCINGGFMAPGNGMPKCMCPPAFTGAFCQISSRNNMAFNGLPNLPNMPMQMPNMPMQMPNMQAMNNMMNGFQQQIMQALGPQPFGDKFMNGMPQSVMASLMPRGPGPMPNQMMLMNMMKKMLSPAPLKVKSFMKISRTIQSEPKEPVPGYRLGDVNTKLPAPVAYNNQDGQQPSGMMNNNMPPMFGNQQENRFPQYQSKPTAPIFYHKYHINNPNGADTSMKSIRQQPQLPPFANRLYNNKEKCEDVLKVGITRCIQEAGIQAFPDEIFTDRNPALTNAICGKGGRIAPCVMAGQNSCGNGLQVVATRRMLSTFLASIGDECNSMMRDAMSRMPNMANNMLPQMNPGMAPSNMPMLGAPNPTMVPMPLAVMRTLQGMPGNRPFLPIPSAVDEPMMQPASPLIQDLKRLECNNGGYVVIDSGVSVCECPQGFFGETCETPLCIPECLNGGMCDSVEGIPMCICVEGFSGKQCEEVVGPVPDINAEDITAVENTLNSLSDNLPLDTETFITSEDPAPIPHVDIINPETEVVKASELVAINEPAVEISEPVVEISEPTKVKEPVVIADAAKPTETLPSETLPSETNDVGEKGASDAQALDDPGRKDLEDDTIFIAGYPLWLILAVSIGFLLLVLIFTLCVCLCVKRRSKRFVDISAVASALPEKSPVKDNVYVVGIPPPPVYEVKGIPNLSYEEAKGEIINAPRKKKDQTIDVPEIDQDDENNKSSDNTAQVTRI